MQIPNKITDERINEILKNPLKRLTKVEFKALTAEIREVQERLDYLQRCHRTQSAGKPLNV